MTRDWLALAIFVIVVLATGLAIGMAFPADAWHAALAKPSWNPPNWLFAPVWSTLYVLIGIAGWRAWFRSDDRVLRKLWIIQMALNFAWSPAFFGAHSALGGLVVILPLLVVIVIFIQRARIHEPTSALLFVPYLAWVAFASALNASIWWLNPV